MALWTGWPVRMYDFEYDGTVEKHKLGGGADRTERMEERDVQAQAQAQAQQQDGARGCRSRRWRRVFMQQK